MLILYDYGLLILEILCMGAIAKIMFGEKFSKCKWRYFIFVIITIAVIVLEKVANNSVLSNNRNLIICMFLLLLCFEFRILKMLICGFMFYFVYGFLILIFVEIFEYLFSKKGQGMDTLGSVMGTILIFIFLYLYSKKKGDYIDVSRNKWLSILAGVLIFANIYIMIYLYYNISEFHKTVYILYFAILGILVIIFGVSYIVIVNNNCEYKLNEKVRIEKTKLMHDYYGLIEARDLEIRRFRHDFKNHISGIMYYVNEEKYEDLKSYVQSIYEDSIFDTSYIYDAGLDFVNAILCKYYDETKEEDIIFRVSGDASPASGIDDYDWSIILPNMLNNAIEATRKVENKNRCIDVQFKYIGNKIMVSVTNPVKDEKSVFNNGNITTSKSDKINHGFGIKNIIKSAKKYNGNVAFDIKNKQFTMVVWMNCDQLS